MLFAIDPTGDLIERWFAPTTDQQPSQHERQGHQGSQNWGPWRMGENAWEMQNADQQKGKNCTYQTPVPETAQRPSPSLTPRRPLEGRFDHLEFTHGFPNNALFAHFGQLLLIRHGNCQKVL
jgi:hypothetical protein